MEKTDKIEQALSLRAAGTSVAEIVEKTGLQPIEVVDAIAEEGDRVGTLYAIKEEAVLISLGVTRTERLKRMVALRDKVEAELDKRDFTDIPTEKLPTILLKINEAIREEVAPPRIISSPTFSKWDMETGESRTIENL